MSGPFAPPLPLEVPAILPLSGAFVRVNGNQASTSNATTPGAANRYQIAPYRAPGTFTPDLLQVNVTTGVAFAQGRIIVYASDVLGRPDGLLFVSPDLDFSATAVVTTTYTAPFIAGCQYWIGVWQSSTATLSSIASSAATMLPAATGTTSSTLSLLRTVAFGDPAPNPWNYVTTAATVVGCPQVWARVA